MSYVEYVGAVEVKVKVNSSSILNFKTLVWGQGSIEATTETSHNRVVSLSAGDTITATFSGSTTGYDSSIFRLTVEYLGEDPNA